MLKETILSNLCYTPLVYGRINKKLGTSQNNIEIEKLMNDCVIHANDISKRGKNYYITNVKLNVVVTVNSNNYRVITASNT